MRHDCCAKLSLKISLLYHYTIKSKFISHPPSTKIYKLQFLNKILNRSAISFLFQKEAQNNISHQRCVFPLASTNSPFPRSHKKIPSPKSRGSFYLLAKESLREREQMHPRALEFRRHCSPLILDRITHSTRIRFESAWRGWPEVDEPETTFHSARYLIDRPRRSRRLILRGRSARFDEEIAGWRCHKGTGTCTRLASPFLPATRPSSEKLLPRGKTWSSSN